MRLSSREETIAAISTPPGAGGIGVIRISGDHSLHILKKLFHPKDRSCDYESHRFYYGHIQHPGTSKIVDEVLAVLMAGPKSYTREDVVEVHCHGSFLILQSILDLVLCSGAVLAAPGEFTKRAFLNGRIDLTQAEAVIDILAAKTRKGVDLAQQQLAGSLYRRIDPIRKSLIKMRAVVEVAIDFPDEDIEIVDHSELIAQMQEEVTGPLKHLLANVHIGKLYREGISLVIAGVPNVGKSSLLNTILQEERALVAPVPGTTRDSIEETVDILGIPVRIIDTAGIRDDAEEVEELGIKRARALINEADLVLFLVDGSREISEGDRKLFLQVQHNPILVAVNKIDLCKESTPDLRELHDKTALEVSRVDISAKHQTGIDDLKQAIFQHVTSSTEQWEEESCAPNFRHQQALMRADEASTRIVESLEAGFTNDLIAVDLQGCLDALAEIVGETTSEDILDVIFEQFCLGK